MSRNTPTQQKDKLIGTFSDGNPHHNPDDSKSENCMFFLILYPCANEHIHTDPFLENKTQKTQISFNLSESTAARKIHFSESVL